MNLLVAKRFFTISRPCAFGDKFLDTETFATTPDAGSGIEGQCFFSGLGIAALLWFTGGNDHALAAFDDYFFEFPDESLALAVTGFVFKQKNVVLGGEDT